MQKNPKVLNFLFAIACGVMVANLYYAQPILSDIAKSLNIAIKDIAMVTTITQIGYAIGMLFVVPLLDILENKKLILVLMGLNIVALVLMGFSQNFIGLLVMSLLVGISSSGVQLIVPFGASMSAPEVRGASVGIIMSGLLLGIMLARPVSSFFSGLIGWNGMFFISAILCLLMVVIFVFVLPFRKASGKMSYFRLIVSMFDLFVSTPILRQRGLYHFLVYGAFCLFWIVSPLVLIDRFGFDNNYIALFALIGIVGALVAPIAGRLADSGKSEWATNIALLAVMLSMVFAALPIDNKILAFIWLGICGIVIDFGVSLNLVVGQRLIYALGDEIRARLNAIYMGMFFVGGALGSYVGGYVYVVLGYQVAFLIGGIMGGIGFAMFRWNLSKNH